MLDSIVNIFFFKDNKIDISERKKSMLLKRKNTLFLFCIALLASCSPNVNTSVSTDKNTLQNTSQNISLNSEKKELKETTLYLVGDSTVSAFHDAYYYPRYGYGTQIGNYLNEKVTVKNLALSGRSSKSFLSESNYTTLTSSLKNGDYLMIGFGHNDEKDSDETVYTNPTGNVEDTTSFQYYLHEFYINFALEKGATPILCTPIVRANDKNDYSGSSGHITAKGNYVECIKNLGNQDQVTTIDLTSLTKDLYEELGFEEAIYFHAWTNSKSTSVDKTHLNIFGAKEIAYLIANALKNTTCSLKDYVLDNIEAPTKEKDLVPNPDFVESTYIAFDPNSYTPNSHFNQFTSEGWYGTAFGDTGGNPSSSSNGFVAEESTPGVFKVGQGGTTSAKGKIAGSSEGLAMVFRQVPKTKNFEISADFKVISATNSEQAGFGLMARDDIYVNVTEKDSSIKSNSLSAGLLTNKDQTMTALFTRENGELKKENNVVPGLYVAEDEAQAKITRIGQNITLELIYKEKTYTKTYYDFDLVAIDSENYYVGMFATRGTMVECTNVNFTITGDAAQA